MAKYKLKDVKDGEELVVPALHLRVSNKTFTDAIAEQLIASGRGKYVEALAAKEVKTDKPEPKK